MRSIIIDARVSGFSVGSGNRIGRWLVTAGGRFFYHGGLSGFSHPPLGHNSSEGGFFADNPIVKTEYHGDVTKRCLTPAGAGGIAPINEPVELDVKRAEFVGLHPCLKQSTTAPGV